MIMHTRRARALRDKGLLPRGVEDADVYRRARSGYLVSDDKTPWQDLCDRHKAPLTRLLTCRTRQTLEPKRDVVGTSTSLRQDSIGIQLGFVPQA